MAGRLKERQREQGARVQAPEESTSSPQQMRPKFSLEHLRRSHCLSACEMAEKAALADRMHELSQLTWQQITQAPRHGQGFEKIARDVIVGGIPACITEETNIIAFRFCGLAPMVGYRNKEVFFIVWLDRAFNLYPH